MSSLMSTKVDVARNPGPSFVEFAVKVVLRAYSDKKGARRWKQRRVRRRQRRSPPEDLTAERATLHDVDTANLRLHPVIERAFCPREVAVQTAIHVVNYSKPL